MQLLRYGYGARAVGTFVVGLLACTAIARCADDPGLKLTPDQKEEFLRKAKILQTHDAKKGITGTVRVTMTDGTVTHDASVQRIDESKAMFTPDTGPPEPNFVDSYRYNIAAWRLARELGLEDMVPPSVERSYNGAAGAFTWWVEDVLMDEAERTAKKIPTPDPDHWNSEMYVVRVFDQLIYNTDRNLTNLLIDKQWRIWMIDHTRSFRLYKSLRDPKNLVQCDRNLLAKLKTLDAATMQKDLGKYATKAEITSLLARRNLIVKFFEDRGESVLYDRPSRSKGL